MIKVPYIFFLILCCFGSVYPTIKDREEVRRVAVILRQQQQGSPVLVVQQEDYQSRVNSERMHQILAENYLEPTFVWRCDCLAKCCSECSLEIVLFTACGLTFVGGCVGFLILHSSGLV